MPPPRLVIADDRVERQLGAIRALPTTRIYDPRGNSVYDTPGRVDRKFLEDRTAPQAVKAQRSFQALRTRLG